MAILSLNADADVGSIAGQLGDATWGTSLAKSRRAGNLPNRLAAYQARSGGQREKLITPGPGKATGSQASSGRIDRDRPTRRTLYVYKSTAAYNGFA